MTPCDICKARDAVFHLTRIENGAQETEHLCGDCAALRGISGSMTPGLADGGALAEAEAAAMPVPPLLACQSCGATLVDLQTAWRVGCATCWTTFEGPLREALRRIHGATQHSGKRYGGAADPDVSPELQQRRERERVHQALAAAVAAERFEDAAMLRDQLRSME